MRALTAPLNELGEFEEIKKKLKEKHFCAAFTGCVESQKLHMAYGLSEGFKNKLIVTFSDLRVKEILEDYRFYDRNVVAYPAKDLIFYQADIQMLKTYFGRETGYCGYYVFQLYDASYSTFHMEETFTYNQWEEPSE